MQGNSESDCEQINYQTGGLPQDEKSFNNMLCECTHTEAFTHKKMFVKQYKLQKYEIDKKTYKLANSLHGADSKR